MNAGTLLVLTMVPVLTADLLGLLTPNNACSVAVAAKAVSNLSLCGLFGG